MGGVGPSACEGPGRQPARVDAPLFGGTAYPAGGRPSRSTRFQMSERVRENQSPASAASASREPSRPPAGAAWRRRGGAAARQRLARRAPSARGTCNAFGSQAGHTVLHTARRMAQQPGEGGGRRRRGGTNMASRGGCCKPCPREACKCHERHLAWLDAPAAPARTARRAAAGPLECGTRRCAPRCRGRCRAGCRSVLAGWPRIHRAAARGGQGRAVRARCKILVSGGWGFLAPLPAVLLSIP